MTAEEMKVKCPNIYKLAQHIQAAHWNEEQFNFFLAVAASALAAKREEEGLEASA